LIDSGGRALAVFVRWPEPGQVLPGIMTRLGAEGAAQVYEAFVGDLVAGLPLAPCTPSLYALDNSEGFRERFPGLPVRSQRGRTEGRRLHACFEELLARSPRAVVVGSSLPDLHPRLLLAAFEMLDRRDAVIGPTERGGFYLLGLREPRDVFRGVRWGAADVLATLLRNVERAHLDYGFFPTRQKIETYEDLVSLSRRIHRPVAPLTYATLQTLGVGRDAREVV
jgi:glycosyltransferase A (GT-A) superfamily protein (DUF2064 family)